MKIELIEFDFDGTIIDSITPSYLLDCKIIKEFGGNPPTFEEFRQTIIDCNWNNYYIRFGVKEKDTKKALETFYANKSTDVKVVDNANDLLENIAKKSIPMGLVTINENPYSVFEKLEKSNLKQFFPDKRIKITKGSKTSCIKQIYEELGILPQKTCFVGDTPIDINDAKAANVTTVGIADERHSYNPKGVIEANPDYLFNNIKGVESLLE